MARPASAIAVVAASLLVTAALSARARTAEVSQDAALSAATSRDSADDAADTALFEDTCGACHDSGVVAGPFRTGADWDEAIQRMQSYGLSAKPETFARIRALLMKKFGKATLNTAGAADLGPVFDVGPAVAEAIVTHRQQNGRFKTLDDLKGVPGLDAAKVDARRARVSF